MTDDLDTFYEALLFIAERPLDTDELAKLGEVPRLQAEAALTALAERLDEDGRGLRVQHHDGAWQLVTAPEVGARLAAYAAREEARLSPAALEALAVIAYRQPCTRADVERVRGRRLRLRHPLAAPPAAGRRARTAGHAGPTGAVRDDLHVPRALRADLDRGAAAAVERRGPARRAGQHRR